MLTTPEGIEAMNGASVYTVGADIGGSHITTGLVSAADGILMEDSLTNVAVDADGEAAVVLDEWAVALRNAMAAAPQESSILAIGIAMPGPFEYDEGVSRIRGLGKYEKLYGMNVRIALKERLEPRQRTLPIIFRNDAACFALGECRSGAGEGSRRAIALTLGTGLGSAFVASGLVVEDAPDVPPNGWLYNAPFEGGMAEDAFSGRGAMALLKARGFDRFAALREAADAAREDPRLRNVFLEFGDRLGQFLSPHIERFQPDTIIVGGNVARAWTLFAPGLKESLLPRFPALKLRQSRLFDQAALIGAAGLPLVYTEPS